MALGAVVLSITGVEALYADMGHFGETAYPRGMVYCGVPSLVLNYFGQGALLLKNPEAIKNPFFLLAPDWALVPMLILATLGDRHCLPGGDFRRVFSDAPGRASGVSLANAHHPYFRDGVGPDLHPVR